MIARRAGYAPTKDGDVVVELDGGGSQRISIELHAGGTALRAHSTIATGRVLREAAADDSPWRYAWERNRLSDLCGFTLDSRGRLVGETWIPLVGLTPEEFAVYVTELARISDWHEFRLTGEDIQ